MRVLLVAACIIAALGAYTSWQGDAGRVSHGKVMRVTREFPASARLPHHRSVSVQRSEEAPSSSLRSQALTITLAAFALVLLLAAAFWERLSEVRIGNMWLKLVDSEQIRRIRERTDDSDKALDAVEIYLSKVERAVDQGHHVSEDLAQSAVDAAVAEVQSDLAQDIRVSDGEVPNIEIEGRPSGEQVLWATSEPQYLPPRHFPGDLASEIEAAVPGRHAIYVLSLVDVLAAVSYEARPDTPLLVHAVATRHGADELDAPALGAAILAMRYLHQVSVVLGRPPGLVIAMNPEHFRPLTLQELGFRKAHREETPGLPPGDYWIQDPAD